MPTPIPSQYQLGATFQSYILNSQQYWISQNPFPVPPVNFAGSPYGPVPTGPSNQEPSNPFTHCDPIGNLGNSVANFMNAFTDSVTNPVNTLVANFNTQNTMIDQLVLQPVLKASDGILGLSGATVTSKGKKFQLGKSSNSSSSTSLIAPKFISTSSQYTNSLIAQIQNSTSVEPVASVDTKKLFASLGVPFVSSAETMTDSLISKGIYVLSGSWVKEGALDMSCAKVLAGLLGGQDLCTAMTPYLSKPSGAFTVVITHKYPAPTAQDVQACEPPGTPLPTGSCSTDTTTVMVEDVLGVDASIDAILASFSFLKRQNLSFYVFWNQVPNPSLANSLALQSLGFTIQEVAVIFAVSKIDQIETCVIADPEGVLAYICNTDDTIVMKGPDGVDPNPSTSEIVDDIIAKALTPRPPTADGMPDNDNVPSMVLALMDPRKALNCPGLDNGSFESGLAQTVAAVDLGFDAANQVLGDAQASIIAAGNGITQILTLVQQYVNDNFPSPYLKCIYPGQGFETSLPLPRQALDAMRFVLNNQIGAIEQSLGVFDNIFSGILAGFCVTQSLVQGLLGPETSSALSSAVSCAAFELPWPQEIKDYLQCLLQIVNLVQRLIRGAINLIRSTFSLLQSLTLQFGLRAAQNLDTCAPLTVINAIAAIQAQLKALT